jgi:hypothetical protein
MYNHFREGHLLLIRKILKISGAPIVLKDSGVLRNS